MNREQLTKLQAELSSLQSGIKELSNAIQAHSEAIHEHHADKTVGPQSVQAIVSFDSQTKKDKQAESDRQYSLQSSIRRAAWFAFGAAVIYSTVAAFQWMEMRNATKATELAAIAAQEAAGTASETLKNSMRSFRVDERAWVEIGKIETTVYPPAPPFGYTFKFGIYPQNFGKTVARDVTIHIDNINGPPSLDDNKKAILMFQDQLFKEQGTNKRSISPNKPGPRTLAPGEISSVPVFSGGQEPKRYGNDFTYTYVLGRIDYVDAFGVKHWNHLCFVVTSQRGDLGHCNYGNDEDENPENSD